MLLLLKRYGEELLNDDSIRELESFFNSQKLVYEQPSKEWLKAVDEKQLIYIFKDACRDYYVFKSYGARNKGQMVLKYSYLDNQTGNLEHVPTVKLYQYFYR
ncbi:MAG: hypothetical protein IKR04_07380 [Clostridia bacterium]|nr:hypothetical protein [Clostridia bacterium]